MREIYRRLRVDSILLIDGSNAQVIMRRFLLFGLMMALTLPASAQLRLSRLFEDGMVMQRDREAPVWGWADAGDEITVVFDGLSYTAAPDAGGKWMVRLPAMEAGGPHEMTVTGKAGSINVRDILVGDVWICSGQSNMEWTVANVNNAAEEIASAHDTKIRHFKVPLTWAEEPEETLAGGAWEVTSPEQVGNFTAVGYFFARALREHIDAPIGLINTSWGGSRIEPWMSAGMLNLDEEGLKAALQQDSDREQQALSNLRARIGDLPEKDMGLVDGKAVWADPALDDTGWGSIQVPAAWEQAGYEGMDGIAWYRTTFNLTEQEAQSGIRLHLGMIDDSDISYVNGQEVGRTENAWNQARDYEVPASVLKAGANVIAVRVEDTGGGGGISGAPELLNVEVGGQQRPLAGTWKFKVGAVSVKIAGRKNQIPTLLYNKMIYPLLEYPIKGVLWYQGESNANNVEEATAYRELFPAMIRGWRQEWGQGEFPFLWVQLANFMPADPQPALESNWATLRESQSATLALPNTAQAVIIDIGEADDIHPRNKQDVGARLARAARKVAYGERLVYSGPVYSGHEVKDGRVFIDFDHTGGGLMSKGTQGNVSGFAVAGADGRFVWAEAKIEGDRVVVWSDQVAEPVAVRYAWGNNPDTANLYNREGLPASPFRTDTW